MADRADHCPFASLSLASLPPPSAETSTHGIVLLLESVQSESKSHFLEPSSPDSKISPFLTLLRQVPHGSPLWYHVPINPTTFNYKCVADGLVGEHRRCCWEPPVHLPGSLKDTQYLIARQIHPRLAKLCLSWTPSQHSAAQCPQGPPMLLQMAGFPSFSWLNSAPGRTRSGCVFLIHPSLDRHLSCFLLLRITMPWTWVCRFLFELLWESLTFSREADISKWIRNDVQ